MKRNMLSFAVVLAIDIAAGYYFKMNLSDYCFGEISKHQMLVAVTTEAWSPYSQVVASLFARDSSFGVAVAFEAAVIACMPNHHY